MVEGVEDFVSGTKSPPIVHVVGEVVEVEQVGEVVVDHAQLGIARVGVGHRG